MTTNTAYTPTLILHGGAGSITRANLPPSLYAQYTASLKSYLTSTHALLTNPDTPATALDAACHAVSLMEDDPLFNCGRGSVFTVHGEIEMEASVAVASVGGASEASEVGGASKVEGTGFVKRSAAVSMLQSTRHPIMLAREVLLMADGAGDAAPRVDEMHGHLSGGDVERWGWGRGLERKGRRWFWTRRRWEEHRRGLGFGVASDEYVRALGGGDGVVSDEDGDGVCDEQMVSEGGLVELPSQGTVGCVCLDRWGNVAVATSTGGLTNKRSGRIGDTPTVGAGFWAESWEEPRMNLDNFAVARKESIEDRKSVLEILRSVLASCITVNARKQSHTSDTADRPPPYDHIEGAGLQTEKPITSHRRAVAMSGTGNGDSFLRTCAARTTASICRFGGQQLSEAITAVSGSGGELQRSAGDRWKKRGEGEGGTIGIEVRSSGKTGTVCFDFNCGGMWRAYYDSDGKPIVMAFREEY